MADLTFAESLQLRETSTDVFENIHEPWVWPFGQDVVPGGLLMSECAAAAYRTVPKDFTLDSLQSHFLGGPKPKLPMVFRVNRLSNGKRFVVRSVVLEQNQVVLMQTTVSFVNMSPWMAPSMRSTSTRKTPHTVSDISLDDLDLNRSRLGSFMQFQRLPLYHQGAVNKLEGGIATSVAKIIPEIKEDAGSMNHILGVINLSDYHVMDAALQLSGIPFGLYAMGDTSRARTESMLKLGTTLNHSIHFHTHDDFRADDLTYIEVEPQWARDGRTMLATKIFTTNGSLIATCTQEAFHVLKPGVIAADSKL